MFTYAPIVATLGRFIAVIITLDVYVMTADVCMTHNDILFGFLSRFVTVNLYTLDVCPYTFCS